MVLAHPFWLFILLLLPLPWILFRAKGYIGFSDERLTFGTAGSSMLYRLPLVLVSIAIVFISIALARPQRLKVESTETIKGRDIVIAVDISGSMGGRFEGEIPKDTKDPQLDKELPPRPERTPKPGEPPPQKKGGRRIDAAQAAVLKFVKSRYVANQGDRIGIQVFDFSPHWSWPLTHDLKTIYRKGEFVDEGLGGGTNFGDIKPGPIDAAAEHFDELGQARTRVLILVTDGEDDMRWATMNRLADALTSRGIRLYVIGVGETLARQDVDIIRLAQQVGGGIFRVENAAALDACFKTIDEMERSVIQVHTTTRHEEVFQFFALAGVIFFLVGMAAEALILSQ